ncbi:MAG: FGGY-family carbohydrate kinase, partial [Athalassotoga sp.]
VTGGGTRNKLWMQIIADIINKELLIPDTKTGASYGDAFMAGVGIGLFSNLKDIYQWIKKKQVIQPNDITHEKYVFNYHIFRSLYETTKPLMHKF